MNDAPAQVIGKLNGMNQFVEVDRKVKFKLMIVAIEENSGCMAELSSVDWSFDLNLERNPYLPLHSQMKLKELRIKCSFDESEDNYFYYSAMFYKILISFLLQLKL